MNGLIESVTLINSAVVSVADISFSDGLGLDSGSIFITLTQSSTILEGEFAFLKVAVTANHSVPEPSTLALFGLFAVAGFARRKKMPI